MTKTLDTSLLKNNQIFKNGQRVYIVDQDHSLLDTGGYMARFESVNIMEIQSPVMEIQSKDYSEILEYWTGENGLYFDMLQKNDKSNFNEEVFNLLENSHVIGVSSSYTQSGTIKKSKLYNKFRKQATLLKDECLPTNLLTFSNKAYEEDSYKNIIKMCQILGYEVYCVDDNTNRLNWALELGAEPVLVEQPWNISLKDNYPLRVKGNDMKNLK